MAGFAGWLSGAYGTAERALNRLRGPFLLFVRLYWGWQFAQDGWGKLTHLDRVAAFFGSLNLPAPHATAVVVALVEFVGGILFAIGLGSRLVSLILFVNMTVAYLSVPDDRTNFLHFFSKPDDFYGATPYTYWFAALIVLIFGPGPIAVDWFLRRRLGVDRPIRAHSTA